MCSANFHKTCSYQCTEGVFLSVINTTIHNLNSIQPLKKKNKYLIHESRPTDVYKFSFVFNYL